MFHVSEQILFEIFFAPVDVRALHSAYMQKHMLSICYFCPVLTKKLECIDNVQWKF